jgi:hypothetical protein
MLRHVRQPGDLDDHKMIPICSLHTICSLLAPEELLVSSGHVRLFLLHVNVLCLVVRCVCRRTRAIVRMLALPRSSLNVKHLFALATPSKQSNERVAFELLADSGRCKSLLRGAGVLDKFVEIAGLQVDLGFADLFLVAQAVFAGALG